MPARANAPTQGPAACDSNGEQPELEALVAATGGTIPQATTAPTCNCSTLVGERM